VSNTAGLKIPRIEHNKRRLCTDVVLDLSATLTGR